MASSSISETTGFEIQARDISNPPKRGSKLPSFLASVYFTVTSLVIYGKSNVTDKLPAKQNSRWRQNFRFSKLSTLEINLYKKHVLYKRHTNAD